MVEYQSRFLPLYKEHRPNSIHVINDATMVDYKDVLEKNNMPLEMDYLQIDLEANNGSTLKTLENMDSNVFDTYKFATVTFEHDIWNTNFGNTRLKSREIFERRGYVCVFTDINNGIKYPYEDWYVHPDLVDMNYVQQLVEANKSRYVEHSTTGTTIHWADLVYP